MLCITKFMTQLHPIPSLFITATCFLSLVGPTLYAYKLSRYMKSLKPEVDLFRLSQELLCYVIQ